MTSQTYVDPTYSKANHSDIKVPEAKFGLNLNVRFQRNGEDLEEVNAEARRATERAIRATGVFDLDSLVKTHTLNVTINNVGDMSAAVGKGLGTGLTFGLVGNMVTDAYLISIEYIDQNGQSSVSEYRHAIHTTVGNKRAPFEGVSPTTPADGFMTVVEQTILNFLKDMQDGMNLVSSDRMSTIAWSEGRAFSVAM